VTICPSCGGENPEGFRFCGSCGAALTEARPAREVRKTVTVLFCDVVGLDALAAVLRARRGELDEAQELAGRALARAEETDSLSLRLDTRWSAAEVFELAGRGDEANALLEESIEIAERYGHLVTAERARERLEGAVK
jgi:tetratricopeptide (TPR) repeat protein